MRRMTGSVPKKLLKVAEYSSPSARQGFRDGDSPAAGIPPPTAVGHRQCHLPTMRPVCPLVGSYGHFPLPSSKATWSRVKPESS